MTDVAQTRREAFLAWMEANGLNPNRVCTIADIAPMTIRDYVNGKTQSLKGDAESKIARAFDLPEEAIFGFGVMPDGSRAMQPNHLRAWREFRRMSPEDVAKKLRTTAPVIEFIERPDYEVSPKWLRQLAPVYDTSPGYLMDHDPNSLPRDILDLATRMRPENRETLVRIAEALQAPTGTDG